MTTILGELRAAFVASGIKTVTKTDVNKGAYVVNAAQYAALDHAGYLPGLHISPTMVPIIDATTGGTYVTSYFNSQRQEEGRAPETRMGRGLLRLIITRRCSVSPTALKSRYRTRRLIVSSATQSSRWWSRRWRISSVRSCDRTCGVWRPRHCSGRVVLTEGKAA